MPRALVTGSSGFVGQVLVEGLLADGYEVCGVDRTGRDVGFRGAKHFMGDVTDGEFVARTIDEARPDVIVHLAAQSSVKRSFDEPFETIVHNTLPALHIVDHLRRTRSRVRTLVVGSADEYGTVEPNALPITEDAPANPESPYALAKSVQNQCCRSYAALYDVDVVLTRSFNHTGPGQRDAFVLSSFARQLVEIRRKRREPVLDVGNLDVRRDFTDVRDVCAAYAALLEKGKRGETYNVCSGRAYRIGDILERLCELAGVEVSIRVDPARLRPVDMPELRGDPSKIRAHTGWTAKRPIEEALEALLEDWDRKLAGEAGRL